MIEISTSAKLVESLCDELFRRIAQADDPDSKEFEATVAWFQIFSMRKIISMGADLYFATHPETPPESRTEYQRIQTTLATALHKAEKIFGEIHGENGNDAPSSN